MDDIAQSADQRFWTRARRHMLGYGGDFVPFVPTRAEGSFLYDASGRRVLWERRPGAEEPLAAVLLD